MDAFGIDGEEYIAAIRAGAVDPFGASADDLQDSLDAFDAELTERLLAMTPEEVAAGIQIPPLPAAPESAFAERFRLDEELVGRMRALETQTARVDGERRVLLAAHMQRAIDLPGDTGVNQRELATMVAVELGMSRRAVIDRMNEAHTIITELPAAHEAAAAGRITTGHLRIIERETQPLRLDDEVSQRERGRVEAELIEIAQRLSTSQLASKAKRVVNDLLTEPLQIRHDTARQKRRVDLFDAGDGMGNLNVYAPITVLTAIMDRATQAAKKKSKDDLRTFDQFRTDAVCELLLAGVVPEDLHGASGITARVAITIPAVALLHDEQQDPNVHGHNFPALLDGKVLVDLDTARRIAGDTATWQRLFTDPVTGVPVTVDSYRPTKAQKDWLFGRDSQCRGPDCNQSALRADLDHTKDFARGGTTSITNLEHLCRADHTLKHDSRWRVEQLRGGVLRWTSPIGQVIENEPEPVGPIFTDMPRTPPKPPKLTRAERRERQRERVERMRDALDRILSERSLPPEQRTTPNPEHPADSAWYWGGDAPDTSASVTVAPF